MLDQAQKLTKAGRLKEADALYDKLLSTKKPRPALLRAAIMFHLRYSHQFRKALPMVEALLTVRPNAVETHALAAEIYANAARLGRAHMHAEKAVALSPDSADVRHAAAYVAMQRNDFANALVHIDHALANDPQHRPSQVQKGWALLGTGDAKAAANHARALWKDRPDDINVIGLYVDAAKVAADDPVFIHMRDQMLPRYRKAGGKRLSHLLKLIGKCLNDQGDHDAAFQAITAAKAAAPLKYDAKGYRNLTEKLRTHISRADYFGKGIGDDRPVLIVGMPRSGSTLLEQILASHPQVISIGESPNLHRIVQKVGVDRRDGDKMVQAVKQIPADDAKRLAQTYLGPAENSDAQRVIDKSLHNFELLGLFAALLPKARVIHMLRDPMDTCLSCYMQTLSPWHTYTQSLDTLGHAYVHYRGLMDHWAKVLPNPMLTVTYENIVNDLEGQARRAVDFLGLDWDPACLEYQKGDASRTLSARQVREPLYDTSIQRWRRYGDHLDPLKRHLARFYPDGFAVTA
ncbi:tetratricopeptide repeat-containing sulfotransferase family protein [Yoonia sp. 2307UL14-13]|uniref:tetratricopeptide repeat-containing sulfotransferase family protein n=1 Tax=Yoonia sp. 2307UL14-13 TaxID=3126506 RepID=UPI003096B58E